MIVHPPAGRQVFIQDVDNSQMILGYWAGSLVQ